MLAGLQADIEARDIIIASLQYEQNFLLVDDAKRHRYFIDKTFDIDLDDPILALQRDSNLTHTSNISLNRNISQDFHDGKAINLDMLLENQRRSYAFYREQLQAADKRYAGLCASFEEERKRLERDAAQGDDVVAMLEKEREKLQAELENERNQNKCLQRELKKALDSYAHQNALCQRQRMVAAQLISEKHRLQKELSSKCSQIEQLEFKLESKSSPSTLTSDRPTSVSLQQNDTPYIKSPSGLRSPVTLNTGGSESLSRGKSISPPSGCCESSNAPPPPPSPLVSGKLDPATSPGVSSVWSIDTSPRTSTDLEKSPSIGSEDDEKFVGSPSPPPPPPQMHLHYPYPGMQGNTHHPPVRGPTRSAAFGGGNSPFGGPSVQLSTSPIMSPSAPHFSPTRPSVSSPTNAPHQFPYTQPHRVTPSSGSLRLNSSGSGLKKPSTPSLLSQQKGRATPITMTTTTTHVFPSRSSGGTSGSRVVVAGRTAATGSGNIASGLLDRSVFTCYPRRTRDHFEVFELDSKDLVGSATKFQEEVECQQFNNFVHYSCLLN
nr:CTTNBP2 N terminal protein [Hymenolepis microstoma]